MPSVGKPTNVKGNYASGNAKWQEVKRAYESAIQHGGVPIMPFAQGMQFVRDVWRPHYNGTGICQALVNYWIAEHAGGGSLWNTLFDQGRLNSGKLIEIANQQNAFGSNLNGENASAMQKLRSAVFLSGKGVVRRPDIVSRRAEPISGAKLDAFDASLGLRLGRAIGYDGMANATEGGYRMISFTSGGAASHVTCAWVQRDIAFFDPNYGEIYFESKAQFAPWFAQFWADSYVNSFTGYDIRDFAGDARFGRR